MLVLTDVEKSVAPSALLAHAVCTYPLRPFVPGEPSSPSSPSLIVSVVSFPSVSTRTTVVVPPVLVADWIATLLPSSPSVPIYDLE